MVASPITRAKVHSVVGWSDFYFKRLRCKNHKCPVPLPSVWTSIGGITRKFKFQVYCEFHWELDELDILEAPNGEEISLLLRCSERAASIVETLTASSPSVATCDLSSPGLTPCQKKNYACKMLYIYMLGYDVDFGHTEAVSLISSTNYPEKQVGYIVASCLLNENHNFLRLAIETVRNDIIGRNETFQCLALTMVGNIGGREFAEFLAPDVRELLLSSSCRPVVRKKAALCLLQLCRKNPDVVNVDGWADRMAQLLDERDPGVLMSSMSLLVALVSNNHEAYWTCIPKCVKILERLVRHQNVPQEYTYYDIPSPWLQVKTMRALQYFPAIDDPETRSTLFEVLQRILDAAKSDNENNSALHAVLFEALALVMHLDDEKEMMSQCVDLLLRKIIVFPEPEPEPNIGYLGLKNMTRMLMVTDVQDNISIRQRALDLLYGMCDVTNAKDIVEEILQYLGTADFVMRKEMSLKAAILAEKFAPDLLWYVDVILQLIDKTGDFISYDIRFRVLSFVTNNEDLQPYAATKVKEYLEKPAVHETMVKVSAYILGEYSHLLSRWHGCSPKEIFSILHEKLPTASTSTIPILLSAYAKILMHTQPPDQELQNQIWAIFNKYESCIDVEIQQRAVEYFALSRKGAALMDILAEMPKFPERQDHNSTVYPQAHSANLFFGCLSSQLGTEGPLGVIVQSEDNTLSRLEGDAVDDMEIDEQTNTVQSIEDTMRGPYIQSSIDSAKRFPDLCLKDSGVLYDDPNIEICFEAEWKLYDGHLVLTFRNKSTTSALVLVQAPIVTSDNLMMKLSPVPGTIPHCEKVRCLLIVANLWPSRDAAILKFSYKFGDITVMVKLSIPIVLNTFFRPKAEDVEELKRQWNRLTGPLLKVREDVVLDNPMSISDMAELLKTLRIMICPFDPNSNVLAASTTFYSWDTGPLLCMIEIHINPANRTHVAVLVASRDYRLTRGLMSFLEKHFMSPIMEKSSNYSE
ncbi:hypothetical protein CCACVL1_01774 [Corchorus capsularis]|uniref:AP-2 complex subunit alpha n=1 Tax=Corchorus capsularis TaxID=210143 RepID=A0A1R3KG02_COCAP|nr:hypothetical protein CCACVL1_01774 [Corchorus capsularis]